MTTQELTALRIVDACERIEQPITDKQLDAVMTVIQPDEASE